MLGWTWAKLWCALVRASAPDPPVGGLAKGRIEAYSDHISGLVKVWVKPKHLERAEPMKDRVSDFSRIN